MVLSLYGGPMDGAALQCGDAPDLVNVRIAKRKCEGPHPFTSVWDVAGVEEIGDRTVVYARKSNGTYVFKAYRKE